MPADAPLIVQGDFTVLLEVASPAHAEGRGRLLAFADLVKSPEHVHTYRITPLSIWNACSAGVSVERITDTLTEFARYPVPDHVLREIASLGTRFGQLVLRRAEEEGLLLEAESVGLANELAAMRDLTDLLGPRASMRSFRIADEVRGKLKRSLIKLGLPVRDRAGFAEGEALALALNERTLAGEEFSLRGYQSQAMEAFHAVGSERGGQGVVVLRCGAGKTVVGMACMTALQTSTLILTTSVTAVRQWLDELLDKTTLEADQIAEYSGHRKEIAPVTVATYQILTHRGKDGRMRHMDLFGRRNWGLIVYDEVHLLPAPVFQRTADLQARRRLGLTATLVREDGLEDEVFALIGPKCIDVPWKELESQGWIARAVCTEIRLPLPPAEHREYIQASERAKFRIAAENSLKVDVVREVLSQHPDDQAIVIGMYVDQVRLIAEELGEPVLTGTSSQKLREKLYREFRAGTRRLLVVSKIANFAVDLPDASLAIQVSGTFGSRQEEAQRLGRILRPKKGVNQARFYTLVSRNTKEQTFALHRQLFLCEQGYEYRLVDREPSEVQEKA